MNIAMIEEDLSLRSGSRRLMCEIPRHLGELGHTVKLFSTRLNPKTCFPGLLSLPVEIVSADKFRSQAIHIINRSVRRNIDHYWAWTKMTLEMSRKIADWRPDAAILNYCGEHWLYPYFYFLENPVGVIILHVTPPVSGSLSLPFQHLTWRRRIEDNLLKLITRNWRDTNFSNSSLILAHSQYLLAQASRQRVIGSRKSAVVPLGVDHSKFYPTGEEEPFALYAGRIRPYKSLELAVLAMKYAPPDMCLIFAGDLEHCDFIYKNRLESIAKRIGISERFKVICSPTESHVVQLMQRCSFFMFPSTIDTFGLVALEAMACGKPIIACRRGGVPEIVENAGLLLEPNVTQWQNAVKKMLSNSNFRQKLGKRALERSKRYSWQNTAHSLVNALKKLPS